MPYRLAGMALLLLLPAGTALPSELPAPILACATLVDDEERLACYDVAVAASVAATAAAAESGPTLLVVEGRDNGDSATFRAPGRWYVEWRSEGSIVTMELHTTGGAFQAVVGTQIGSGSGRSASFPPGEYRLAVRGDGAWELRAYLE